MKFFRVLLYLLFGFTTSIASLANNEIDSLIQVIEGQSQDSSKAKAADKLAWKFMFTNPDTTIIIATDQLEFAKKSGVGKLVINAFNNLATANAVKGNLQEAEGIFFMAERKAKEIDDPVELSVVYNNLGLVQSMKGLADNAIKYYRLSLKQYERQKVLKKGKGDTYNNIGILFMDKGELDEAIYNYEGALEVYQDLEIVNEGVANAYNNIGIIYKEKGNFPRSLDYHLKSMKVFEQIGNNSSNYANVLNNIGVIYGKQDDYNNALNYYRRAEKMFKSINDNSINVSKVNNNIGEIYIKKDSLDKALLFFRNSLEIQKLLNESTITLTDTYRNLGKIKEQKRDFSEALKYYELALKSSKEIEYKKGVAKSLYDLGNIEVVTKNYIKGILKCKESFDLSDELGFLESKMEACRCLYEAYERSGNTFQAFKYYKLYREEKDSLINQESTKAITEKIMQYSFDKRQYQDSLERSAEARKSALIQKEKDIKKEAEIQKQRAYSIAAGVGFILMLGLAFVLFRGYKNKQKANEIITEQKNAVEEQKEIIEEKNREIVDSISYAKRIQSAILPSQRHINSIIPDAFVYFNPKDIVSGDFYWVDQKDDYAFFAAVDCTGHGVPGALVSVVGHNNLNRVLNEFNIIEPAKMLDQLNLLVEETFSTSSDSIKDGMDLALCKLNKKTLELEYSGANNPLYIIRDTNKLGDVDKSYRIIKSEDSNKSLIEIKSDKQPIGKFDFRKPFENHKIQLIKGDYIYIFSDGFADQFGGEKGKKFMYKPFKKLLMELTNYSMKDQKSKMQSVFINWKEGVDQIDDVCVFGVKVA